MNQKNQEASSAEAEVPTSARDQLFELILAYLPPIPNSQGWECRGTVAETLTDVLMEGNYRQVVTTPDNAGVGQALNCIDQLRSRGDQPGQDFADIFQPLADAYQELLRTARDAAVVTPNEDERTEWQVRMPEDRNSEAGWKSNVEAGALYLERDHNAEVRTRTVTQWKLKERGQ